jgi:2-polyprenyl-3-methyl-5-hydroxy-6-metoxy-1,4-benzoquinol methylase
MVGEVDPNARKPRTVMTTETANPAQAYQSYFGPAIFEPLAERVLAVAAPAAGERVLDVACGTGILTRRAAAHAGA